MTALEIPCKIATGFLLEQMNDDELIQLIKKDNRYAVNVLIDRYRSFVHRMVRRRVDSSQAEDITQDILVKMFVSIKKFEQRSRLSTWLYRITVNHLLQHNAAQRRWFAAGDIEGHTITTHNSEGQERDPTVFLGMTLCMDAQQRMVITLADIFKLDHRAAGEIMHISPANFRKRLSRSRRELKNFVSNQCSLLNSKGSCTCKFKTKFYQQKGWVSAETKSFNGSYVEAAIKLVNECVVEGG